MISEEIYGCDNCKKQISVDVAGKLHHDFLEITVFRNPSDSSSVRMQFCSWRCALAALKKVKSDYFVTLPMLHYDNDVVKGQSVKDFFQAIREFK